jgi:hypothetical protein
MSVAALAVPFAVLEADEYFIRLRPRLPFVVTVTATRSEVTRVWRSSFVAWPPLLPGVRLDTGDGRLDGVRFISYGRERAILGALRELGWPVG